MLRRDNDYAVMVVKGAAMSVKGAAISAKGAARNLLQIDTGLCEKAIYFTC